MKTRRHGLKVMLAFLGVSVALLMAAVPVHAQRFPTKPVRIFTPFPAGSGPDAALRLVAERLSKKWGQAAILFV